MVEDDIFRKVFSHTLDELEIPNIAISIQKSDFEKLRNAHDSIHEFSYMAHHLVNPHEEFLVKSAFLFYHNEVFEQAHRSFLEALSGCYNAANTLLRSTLELLIKGAFWECMAHKKYRENAEVIKKTGTKIENSKVTRIDLLKEIFKRSPSTEDELEKTSGGIFDEVYHLFEDEELRKMIPNVKDIVKQLAEWDVFDPIQEVFTNPVEYVYDIYYKELSADVHVIPDKTNIGKRLLAEKEVFETEVIPEELNDYVETLHKVIDIGIVIELNILEDIIIENEKSKKWLRERLINLMELELNFASTKIVEIQNEAGEL